MVIGLRILWLYIDNKLITGPALDRGLSSKVTPCSHGGKSGKMLTLGWKQKVSQKRAGGAIMEPPRYQAIDRVSRVLIKFIKP